ncbi:MAG: hypothetical protein ACI9D0_001452 [Bacteroidia bacterium]|jgi:hypothetical protein
MSAIGRIFLVLNLILSAVFLGWASNALSTSDEYKGQLDTLQAAHEQAMLDGDAAAADLQAQLNTAKASASTARNSRDDFETLSSGLKSDLEAQTARNETLNGSVTTIGSNIQDLNNTLAAVEQAKDDAVALAAQAKSDADDATRAKMAADQARAAAEDNLDQANAMIAMLEAKNNSAGKQISSLETTLATAVEVYGIPLSEIMPQPIVNGTVLSVLDRDGISLVSLNVGSDDEVTRGMTFEVWSGSQYKAQVRVESVMPGMCSALVIKTVDGTTITEGDHADTRL